MDFYVYIHRRKSDGQIFYVGKGQGRRSQVLYCRNPHWENVANKHGVNIEILSHWDTEEDAFKEEKKLIEFYRNLGVPLTNMTDGGEGGSGMIHSEETRLKIKSYQVGRVREESTKKKMSAYARKRPPEHTQKLSAGRIKPLKIIFEGGQSVVFSSQTEAAKFLGVGKHTIRRWIEGTRTPKSKYNVKQIISNQERQINE